MPPRQESNSTEVERFYSTAPTRRTISRTGSDSSSTDKDNEKDTYNIVQDYGHSDETLTAKNSSHSTQGISPTISLPLLVFIDMFAVSLVVPLLFQYCKNAGVTSANERELLSSVFSSSQIVGGIVLGAMTDAQLVKRKTILLLSFGGSAVAYAMIAFGGFHALIFSRILVGLVKQTMTVTTSILTKCTTEDNRTKYLGRLQSSATASWIVGPSAGAILFKYVDHRAPALLACALFVFNMILAAVLLKDEIENDSSAIQGQDDKKSHQSESNKKKTDFWTNLKACFSSPALGSVIATMLVFSWVNRATSYSSLGSYYENMYGMEPHHRGYIQSYQQVLGFIIQSSLIGPLLSRMGGERSAVCWAAFLLAAATFLEMKQSISFFLLALSPAISCCTTLMNVSLRSLLTRVAPEESIFSVFAALDVLQNASAVTIPFYRTFLFRILGGSSGDQHSDMTGDPDPFSWVISSGVHWLIASILMVYLLRPSKINSTPPHVKQQ
jgi:predicted MFS family arabinose efflux permease